MTECMTIRYFHKCRRFLSLNTLAIVIFAIALCLFQTTASADHKSSHKLAIAVLYPTVNKQYSNMFDELVSGITSVPGYTVHTYRVSRNTRSEDIQKWSGSLNIAGYIALGQTTYKLVDTLNRSTTHPLPIIAGGMVATPPGISGISLSADPEAFFRKTQLLNPDISRIFFVHSLRNNGWLIPRAREISKQYGIEFVPLQVSNVKQATLQYNIVLQSIRPRTDAIWIPLDNVAPLEILLPEILQAAWEKHITILSNNLLHVRRGALFALYPDQFKQGRRLVALLQHHILKPKMKAELYPSVDLKTAVNIRTANHLDMRYTREMKKSFDQLYPGFH